MGRLQRPIGLLRWILIVAIILVWTAIPAILLSGGLGGPQTGDRPIGPVVFAAFETSPQAFETVTGPQQIGNSFFWVVRYRPTKAEFVFVQDKNGIFLEPLYTLSGERSGLGFDMKTAMLGHVQ